MAIKIISITTETCDICKTSNDKTGYAVYTSTNSITLGNITYDNICKSCSKSIHKFIKEKWFNK